MFPSLPSVSFRSPVRRTQSPQKAVQPPVPKVQKIEIPYDKGNKRKLSNGEKIELLLDHGRFFVDGLGAKKEWKGVDLQKRLEKGTTQILLNPLYDQNSGKVNLGIIFNEGNPAKRVDLKRHEEQSVETFIAQGIENALYLAQHGWDEAKASHNPITRPPIHMIHNPITAVLNYKEQAQSRLLKPMDVFANPYRSLNPPDLLTREDLLQGMYSTPDPNERQAEAIVHQSGKAVRERIKRGELNKADLKQEVAKEAQKRVRDIFKELDAKDAEALSHYREKQASVSPGDVSGQEGEDYATQLAKELNAGTGRLQLHPDRLSHALHDKERLLHTREITVPPEATEPKKLHTGAESPAPETDEAEQSFSEQIDKTEARLERWLEKRPLDEELPEIPKEFRVPAEPSAQKPGNDPETKAPTQNSPRQDISERVEKTKTPPTEATEELAEKKKAEKQAKLEEARQIPLQVKNQEALAGRKPINQALTLPPEEIKALMSEMAKQNPRLISLRNILLDRAEQHTKPDELIELQKKNEARQEQLEQAQPKSSALGQRGSEASLKLSRFRREAEKLAEKQAKLEEFRQIPWKDKSEVALEEQGAWIGLRVADTSYHPEEGLKGNFQRLKQDFQTQWGARHKEENPKGIPPAVFKPGKLFESRLERQLGKLEESGLHARHQSIQDFPLTKTKVDAPKTSRALETFNLPPELFALDPIPDEAQDFLLTKKTKVDAPKTSRALETFNLPPEYFALEPITDEPKKEKAALKAEKPTLLKSVFHKVRNVFHRTPSKKTSPITAGPVISTEAVREMLNLPSGVEVGTSETTIRPTGKTLSRRPSLQEIRQTEVGTSSDGIGESVENQAAASKKSAAHQHQPLSPDENALLSQFYDVSLKNVLVKNAHQHPKPEELIRIEQKKAALEKARAEKQAKLEEFRKIPLHEKNRAALAGRKPKNQELTIPPEEMKALMSEAAKENPRFISLRNVLLGRAHQHPLPPELIELQNKEEKAALKAEQQAQKPKVLQRFVHNVRNVFHLKPSKKINQILAAPASSNEAALREMQTQTQTEVGTSSDGIGESVENQTAASKKSAAHHTKEKTSGKFNSTAFWQSYQEDLRKHREEEKKYREEEKIRKVDAGNKKYFSEVFGIENFDDHEAVEAAILRNENEVRQNIEKAKAERQDAERLMNEKEKSAEIVPAEEMFEAHQRLMDASAALKAAEDGEVPLQVTARALRRMIATDAAKKTKADAPETSARGGRRGLSPLKEEPEIEEDLYPISPELLRQAEASTSIISPDAKHQAAWPTSVLEDVVTHGERKHQEENLKRIFASDEDDAVIRYIFGANGLNTPASVARRTTREAAEAEAKADKARQEYAAAEELRRHADAKAETSVDPQDLENMFQAQEKALKLSQIKDHAAGEAIVRNEIKQAAEATLRKAEAEEAETRQQILDKNKKHFAEVFGIQNFHDHDAVEIAIYQKQMAARQKLEEARQKVQGFKADLRDTEITKDNRQASAQLQYNVAVEEVQKAEHEKRILHQTAQAARKMMESIPEKYENVQLKSSEPLKPNSLLRLINEVSRDEEGKFPISLPGMLGMPPMPQPVMTQHQREGILQAQNRRRMSDQESLSEQSIWESRPPIPAVVGSDSPTEQRATKRTDAAIGPSARWQNHTNELFRNIREQRENQKSIGDLAPGIDINHAHIQETREEPAIVPKNAPKTGNRLIRFFQPKKPPTIEPPETMILQYEWKKNPGLLKVSTRTSTAMPQPQATEKAIQRARQASKDSLHTRFPRKEDIWSFDPWGSPDRFPETKPKTRRNEASAEASTSRPQQSPSRQEAGKKLKQLMDEDQAFSESHGSVATWSNSELSAR